jgi:catechol 2,3-dioxygenase-like lactoylglutathione lyase family enzyme
VNFAINHLQHIGIPVSNLSNSEAFYQKLGFSVVMTGVFDSMGEQGKVAMLQRGKMIIELYQLPSSQIHKIKARLDGHIDHIAFDVDDVDTALRQLTEDGFNILEPAPVFLSFWTKGCRYFNITGPDGERLEFNEIL